MFLTTTAATNPAIGPGDACKTASLTCLMSYISHEVLKLVTMTASEGS